MVEKYIDGGSVGVLYSPGFGAGWSTWGDEDMAVDKRLVEAFIRGGADACISEAKNLYPSEYLGGGKDLQLTWVKLGSQFEIAEYDGDESVREIGKSSFRVA
jgi:hypothetical protein